VTENSILMQDELATTSQKILNGGPEWCAGRDLNPEPVD